MNAIFSKTHKLNTLNKSAVKNRLPPWFRQDIPDEITLNQLKFISSYKINTVCKSAQCPNIGSCFKSKHLSFMILGDKCTRNCRFCAVDKSKGGFLSIDREEPFRISQLVKELGLKYVVITSVSRDDLLDAGAGEFARTIELIHKVNKDIKAEVLIPDFSGNTISLKTVIDAGPCVIGHNLETVRRLYRDLRPLANYELSLRVLSQIKEIKAKAVTKSSLILGLGEREDEVIYAMKDLSRVSCDILTLGQYLAPSAAHYPVKEFITLEKFKYYQEIGMSLGFKSVFSGPLVRSSYQADEIYKELAGALCIEYSV